MKRKKSSTNFSAIGIKPKNNAVSPPRYHIGECCGCEVLNRRLCACLLHLQPGDIVGRNHYLGGRYENLYVTLDSIPDMRVVLDLAIAQAAHLLHHPKRNLRLGWWINIMQPGNVTYPHTHDDDDELLSGVYYIDVPANSGNLVLLRGKHRIEIIPRAASYVFFAPDLLHEVTRNESPRPRISVGFNIGPAPA